MLNLGPEHELFVRCLRTGTNEENAQRLQWLVQMDLDWAHIVETAKRHGLAPLLYLRLKSQSRAHIPGEILQRLRSLHLSNLARNVLLTRELLAVSRLFSQAGIRFVAFKGPVLASSVFGDVAFRVFDDLDFLVPREQIAKLKCLLHREGYRPLFPVPMEQEIFFLRFHYEHAFRREDQEIIIDIHWASTLPYLSFMLGFERLWERSRNVLVEGRAIRTLASDDLLTILCEHGCKHGWKRLSWIVDIAGLLTADPSLNLPEVIATSEKIGSKRMVCLGLCLASDLLGTELPGAILEQIDQDRKVRELSFQVHRHIFRPDKPAAAGIGPDIHRLYVQTMLRTKDKITPFMVGLFVPTSIELNLFSLPAPLFFLYILLRPLRLAVKYATFFLERLI